MSASNQTTNYELPIFVGTDIPTWLTDFNGAMLKLDTALHNLKLKNDTEDEDISDLEGAVSDINQAIDREKVLKGWKRSRKEALIDSMNPNRQDLSEKIL